MDNVVKELILEVRGGDQAAFEKLRDKYRPLIESSVQRYSADAMTAEDREEMYRRIDRRVDIMMAEGLMFEVRGLYEAGLLDSKYTSSGAIGYKELLPAVTGEGTVDVGVSELKMATRHYAKRQLTWFNRKKDYHKIYVDKENPLKRAMEILGDFNG